MLATRQQILDRNPGQARYIKCAPGWKVFPLPERPPADAKGAGCFRAAPVPVDECLSDLVDIHAVSVDCGSTSVNCPSTIGARALLGQSRS